ncbi:MAG: sporulation protein [Bacillota bacterium]
MAFIPHFGSGGLLPSKDKDGKPFVTGPANPQHIINFACTVPHNIPISYGRTRYKMEAGLDIKNAINPIDQKNVRIIPAPEQAAVMTAIEQLGFRHKRESGNFNGRRQWFELQSPDFMQGRLDELELAFSSTTADLTIYMQIDKKAKGLMGMLLDELDLDEQHVALKLSSSQLIQAGKPDIAGTMAVLKKFIQEEYEKIL